MGEALSLADSEEIPIVDERTIEATRLWTTALPTVSAFVTSLVRDFTARDDVLQETAVAVLQSFDRYDRSRPFVGWSIGIARNQVRLYFRRKAGERIVLDSEAVDALAAAFDDVAGERNQILDRLGECLAELDGRSRQMCELRYERDMKPAAIAEAIGTGANTVAKALQRIRDRLRECVERKSALTGAEP